MIDKVLTAIFGSKHERDVKRMLPIVADINALEPEISSLTDDQLRERTQQFRERLKPVVEAVDGAKREVPRDETAIALSITMLTQRALEPSAIESKACNEAGSENRIASRRVQGIPEPVLVRHAKAGFRTV